MKKIPLTNLKPLLTSLLLISPLVNFNLSASELTAQRALFPNNQGSIAAQMNFEQSESGDIYIAYRMNGEGDLYFLDQNGFSLEARPYETIDSFSGTMDLPEFDTGSLPAANYQMYQVLVTSGSNVYDSNNWIGGDTALHSLNFPVGQDPSVNIDQDGNGWSDDDINRDGFSDDDINRDGYHDDDINRDGYHDDDINKDGYHDNENGSDNENEGFGQGSTDNQMRTSR